MVTKPTIIQTWAHSNNYKTGRSNPVNRITAHHIVGTGASAEATFKNPDRKASATYSVGEDGIIRQHVREEDTSYSDGNWDSNTRTISIEHAGGLVNVPYTATMYQSAIHLWAWIIDRYKITDFKKHKDVSLKGTACPGNLEVNLIIDGALKMVGSGASIPVIPSPVPTPNNYLKRGNKGDAVKELQKNLLRHGFDPGAIDGDFGPKTGAAVRAFQASRNLIVDEIVGPITQTALAKTTRPDVYKGSNNIHVGVAQAKLKSLGYYKGKVDNIFGDMTKAAVKAFQKDHGLKVDGWVGRYTWGKLGV